MQKSVLFIVSRQSAHLVCELPYLFKKAGFRVTMLAFPHWSLKRSSYVDEWIDSNALPAEMIEQAAFLVAARHFDLKIISSDALIWALLESPLDESLKRGLYPIGNWDYLGALEGKVGVAKMCKKIGIPTPESKVVTSLQEASDAAREMGFPVLLKISQSGGGNGVYRCFTEEEIMTAPIGQDRPFLVEKFIEGDLISVEAFFFQGHLAAYAYSKMIYFSSPFAPSLERIFMPCIEIEPTLVKLGKDLKMTGFANISLVKKRDQHLLFELDFRPNRWVRHSELVGVDWSEALRAPLQSSQKPDRLKRIRHFPEDFRHAIRKKRWKRVFYWLFNLNHSWGSLPLYDLKWILGGASYAFQRVFSRSR